MKKILHYVGNMSRGGMEMFIMNIYRHIDRSIVQFDFAVHTTKKCDFDDEIIELGGKLYSFPQFRKNPIAYRKAWRAFFQKHGQEYECFHFHTNSLANITALEEAFKANIPRIIIHSHSKYANKGKLQLLNNYLHMLHRVKVKRIATDLFACSEDAAMWLYGSNENVRIIKNGVDLNLFSYNEKQAAKMREKLDLDGKIVVGHIGRFIPVKNHMFLLDIIKEMINMDNRVMCLLIGEGPLMDECKRKSVEMEIASHIVFLGVRDDVQNLLMVMDVLFLPSLYEGLPFVLVEAQANGLPAVTSDTVPNEAKIKENIYTCKLNDEAKKWAHKAFEAIKAGRLVENCSIQDAGFDIHHTVNQYMNIVSK